MSEQTLTEQQAEENGAGPQEAVPPPEPTFPVDSFKAAAPYLRRPFTERAVKFKVQSDWEGGAMVVAYIDARLVVERLNLVCPHLWRDEYEPLDGGRMMCRLTVDEITRPDIGEGYQGKGLYSDALKRAAVKFGIGVTNYAIPRLYLDVGPNLKQQKRGAKLKTRLTPAGEKFAREKYREWLEAEGIAHFGGPLDHGDAENSIGDPAEHDPPAENGDSEKVAPPTGGITKAAARALFDRARDVGVNGQRLSMRLTQLGVEHGEIRTITTAVAALRLLTSAQAAELDKWLLDRPTPEPERTAPADPDASEHDEGRE